MKALILSSLLVFSLSRSFPRLKYKEPQTPVPNYIQKNFTTLIDNFGYSKATFNMRYFINDTFWNNSDTNPGPIFFYCGNQGAIEMFIQNTGYMEQLGSQMKAVIVFAQHRYFGKSLPFGNQSYTSQDHLRYLSPHQALADYAYLITQLKTQYKNAPAIAWGGSYGAMLAAWFRMKYPNIVTGAIAASAPLYHFYGDVNASAFNKVITDDFSKAAPHCPGFIKDGFDILNKFKYNDTQYYKLSKTFKTCQSIDTPDDVMLIYQWIVNAFTYMAMTDYPYPTNFLQNMPAWPVKAACNQFESIPDDPEDYQLLEAMKAAANIYYNYTGQNTCSTINQDYDNDLGQDGWDYLACTTLNMPIDSNGVTDMFLPSPWDQTTVNSKCLQRFGVAPDVYYPKVYFGSSSNHSWLLRWTTNIVFSNGDLDPWQTGAVTYLTGIPDIVAFNMTDAAHHLDLRTPNPADPQSVIDGRSIEKRTIETWIANYKL